jgi:hypothetical protein
MIVTDYQWEKSGEKRTGYYMDGYIVENLLGMPRYLSKAFDAVGIISGHAKVRIGKSTHASQIGYLLAWLQAGGKIELGKDETGKRIVKSQTSPIKEVNFNLDNNVVFTPTNLMKTSEKLFQNYGKNQVIMYDEARGGLASDRAMESINKTMSEWFEQCGQYGHIILLVLPNFFKLHEDYAVARSLFLSDVFADKKYNRGYFNFYNELQKEKLYYWGKKRIGVTAKYSATNESFWGRFIDFMPWDKTKYEILKRKAISQLKKTRYERKFIKRFNASCFLWKKFTGMTTEQMASELTPIVGEEISSGTVEWAINAISRKEGREDIAEDE